MMNANETIKDAAAANASAIDDLICDLADAVRKLSAARDAFIAATTWSDFDNAVVDVKSAIAHLPKHRDEAMVNIVEDPA